MVHTPLKHSAPAMDTYCLPPAGIEVPAGKRTMKSEVLAGGDARDDLVVGVEVREVVVAEVHRGCARVVDRHVFGLRRGDDDLGEQQLLGAREGERGGERERGEARRGECSFHGVCRGPMT